jgi:hypothetical protein
VVPAQGQDGAGADIGFTDAAIRSSLKSVAAGRKLNNIQNISTPSVLARTALFV